MSSNSPQREGGTTKWNQIGNAALRLAAEKTLEGLER